MIKPISIILHSLLLLVFIGTWGSVLYYFEFAPSLTSTATIAPTQPVFSDASVASRAAIPTIPTLTPSLPSPSSLPATVEPTPDADWTLLQPGLDRRVIEIYNGQNQHAESLYVWRLDQNYFRMDVAYVERPKSLETWQKETQADLVVNGGYFSIENERYFPDGLAIANGEAFGRSFNGFGGMLAIDQSGAELRWLVQEPYHSDEPLQAALQSFPILVQPGGGLGFPAERENHARARRTVIAQDRDGRILFMVAPEGYFTLHQLSVYLTESDLNLDIALNLDGGGSTGILVANPREVIPSKVLLPFVILVHAR